MNHHLLRVNRGWTRDSQWIREGLVFEIDPIGNNRAGEISYRDWNGMTLEWTEIYHNLQQSSVNRGLSIEEQYITMKAR